MTTLSPGNLILRGIAEIFDTSEFKNPWVRPQVRLRKHTRCRLLKKICRKFKRGFKENCQDKFEKLKQ